MHVVDDNVWALNNEASGGLENIQTDSGGESELSLNMAEEHLMILMRWTWIIGMHAVRAIVI